MTDIWDRRLGFWWIAADHPDHPAILSGPDGPRSYAELAGDANQLVHLFRALGAGHGSAVAVMADNGNALIEASLACQSAGMHLIPLNPHLTTAELSAILEHSAARVLVVGARFADLVDGAPPSTRVLTIGEAPGLSSLATARADHPRSTPADRRPGSLFVYTSGTTGRPKGIRRPLPEGDVDRIAHDGALFSRAFDFRPFEGPMLVSTGMFHGGSHSFYMGGLAVGHSLVIMPRFDPAEALALIEEHSVTTAYMVPTQFHRLLRLPDHVRSRHDLSSLRSVVHSAAPCPRDVKQQMFDWWGPVIWETYGGMEGAATIAKPHHWLARPGTVGRAIRGTRLAILDDDGNELPPGQTGHIHLDNGVGFEYHDDPEQTRAAFTGRRFSLGDIGHLDEEGFLFVSDRAKDMLISGGVNVYPAEIEAVLLSHPSVRDCAVVGVPDEEWGEVPLAVVQPAEGVEASVDLRKVLEGHCREHLAGFKCPRRWEFRDELPRTDAGKLYKRRIRDEHLGARADE